MFRKRSRLWLFALTGVLVMGLLAACGTTGNNAGTTTASGKGTSVSSDTVQSVSNETTGSAQAENLTYWDPYFWGTSQIPSMNENVVYQEISKRLNIKVEFIHPISGGETEAFNLLLASGTMPDMIMGAGSFYPGGLEKGVSDGVYLKLNDLIDQYAPNYKKLRESDTQLQKDTVLDSGTIASFRSIISQERQLFYGPVIRQDILDELNLETPKLVSDWDNVLTTINDNKSKYGFDFVLYTGTKALLSGNQAPFAAAYGVMDDFICVDGQVKYGPIEAGFKDVLTLSNKWYKAGIIDPDFATRDNTDAQALLYSGVIPAAICTKDEVKKIMAGQTDNAAFQMKAVEYPVVKAGDTIKLGAKPERVESWDELAITTSCKNVEAAMKWIDYHFSDEGSFLLTYGIEGDTYTLDESGSPVISDDFSKNIGQQNWTKIVPLAVMYYNDSINTAKWTLPDPIYESCVAAWDAHRSTITDNMPSFISLTESEGDTLSSIIENINTYKDECILKFITGEMPLSEFDNYVSEIKKMGIDQAIALKQTAVDRYEKR